MEILCVKHDIEARMFQAVQEVSDGNGGTLLYLCNIPQDTLEWRAAEYLIDPSATDLLLDVVLYEGFLPPEPNGIPMLMRASTIDEAREYHVGKVMEIKANLRPQGANRWKQRSQRLSRLAAAHPDMALNWEPFLTDDALQTIRDKHDMSEEVLTEKALLVSETRDRMASKRKALTDTSRAEMIRSIRARGAGNVK